MRTGLPSQTQMPAIATTTKAKQVRAWRIGGPNNEVKRLAPGLSRTAAPAKVTALSKDCGYAGQRDRVEAKSNGLKFRLMRTAGVRGRITREIIAVLASQSGCRQVRSTASGQVRKTHPTGTMLFSFELRQRFAVLCCAA